MHATLGGEAVQHCTPALSNSSVVSREYDGISVYSPPSVCSLNNPALTVVHGDLHTTSCTAEELYGEEGLSAAVVGEPARFQVVARDAFGNIRFVENRIGRILTRCLSPIAEMFWNPVDNIYVLLFTSNCTT